MKRNTSNVTLSNSARDCPVCGEPVPWTRYWLRAGVWVKWTCPKCGSLLTFDRRRRGLTALSCGVAGGIFSFALGRYGFLIAFPVFIIACSASALWDRATVIGHRNTNYCPSCRYDLTGTLQADISRCPECGYSLSAKGA